MPQIKIKRFFYLYAILLLPSGFFTFMFILFGGILLYSEYNLSFDGTVTEIVIGKCDELKFQDGKSTVIRIIPNSPMKDRIKPGVKIVKKIKSFNYITDGESIVDLRILFNHYFHNRVICPLAIFYLLSVAIYSYFRKRFFILDIFDSSGGKNIKTIFNENPKMDTFLIFYITTVIIDLIYLPFGIYFLF